jgi:phosphatidate cytidylyltransferase
MALNRKTFQTRALSALLFVVVMAAGLLIDHWTFFLLFTIIHFGCWLEYQQLVGLIDKGYQEITPFHKYGVMLAGWCMMLYFTSADLKLFGVQLQELGWWLGLVFMFVLPITEILFTRNIRLKNIGHSLFGLIYISLSLGLMMDLRKEYFLAETNILDMVPQWHLIIAPCAIILSIWINDTMAYIVGSFFGKTPLTKISPRKTWEGTVGGILLAITTMGILAWQLDFDVKAIIIISTISSIAGTFGDLLESKLKRLAGVKDSGYLMPGHGGFLDRFDSLLLAVPFVWIYVRILINL